ncbi:MAG: ABC transporter ATP-binding protein [Clostridiales bacterium]|nr:ABC transporter ATP-binding protein [Clostridiales bacterium]
MKKIKLEVRNISKSFDDRPVISGVSFIVKENEIVSLTGLSGSGKSTIFNIISGVLKPDMGNVLIDNVDFTGRSGRLGYMQQKDLLLPWKRLIDNVSLPLLLRGVRKHEAREEAASHFKTFGLYGCEYLYPNQLSGGQRQRAALLRTWLFSGDLLLLDEAFGSLDAITRSQMQDWLLEVFTNLRTTVLLITHDLQEAVYLSDRIYILSGKPAKVREEIDVNLARPRDHKMAADPAYGLALGSALEALSAAKLF